ncbi:MAG: hypothetical protein HBSAPP04_01280 [Ignavibacteriaceae bacterium]|nr:MAG: hypothetical protein HBSAPP04_01280 [Ignavibacteriaceae bacterium]
MGYYTEAQICVNGHPINPDMKENPERNKKFCDKCGSETIDKCKNCAHPINGEYISPGCMVFTDYVPPGYCSNCGNPYPWTTAKIAALVELAKMEEVLSDEEVESFTTHIREISSDTPNTVVSANKLIKLGKKFGARAWAEIRILLVEIASETAKKILLDKG